MALARKEAGAVVGKRRDFRSISARQRFRRSRLVLLFTGVLVVASGTAGLDHSAVAQELPADELQVNVNTYFDNFRVNIVYPSVSFTKQIGGTTSLTARYLVDAISAASMKSLFRVDGITSATSRDAGGSDGLLDEVRHEFGAGVTQLVSRATVSVNGLYSTEHDYTSRTLAVSMSMPFALKNTVLQLGAVHSWDVVSPQNRTWDKDKRVLSLNAGVTQVLSKRTALQVDGSFSDMSGFLSDAYQVVTILGDGEVNTFEPIHPEQRTRRAVGVRVNQSLGESSAISVGYRYYWDNWDLTSNTANIRYSRRVAPGILAKIGVRGYFQSKAYFFEPAYSEPVVFMTVDSKLNSGYTYEVQFGATVSGDAVSGVPVLNLLARDDVDLIVDLNLYKRHTDSADWHSRLKDLYAYMFSVGYRYRF